MGEGEDPSAMCWGLGHRKAPHKPDMSRENDDQYDTEIDERLTAAVWRIEPQIQDQGTRPEFFKHHSQEDKQTRLDVRI